MARGWASMRWLVTSLTLSTSLGLAPLVRIREIEWPGSSSAKAVRLEACKLSSGIRLGVCGIRLAKLTRSGLPASMAPSGDPVEDRVLMSELWVEPEHRCQGIGHQLIEASEEVARAWGFGELLLFVDERNSNARRLYESMGYSTPTGVHARDENELPPWLEWIRRATSDPVCLVKEL
jgi:GNAT superfamily N-acetyltransferase